MGKLVFEAVSEFFERGSLLKQMNNAIVALIPKGKQQPSVSDFRPISCCNVVYKTISKIFAKRLAPKLDDIIDEVRAFKTHTSRLRLEILRVCA